MRWLLLALLLITLGAAWPAGAPDSRIAAILSPIREKYKVPAMGAAFLTSDGLRGLAVDGVRRNGSDVPVTASDCWHLGSDTKMMTASMIGSLVHDGLLQWDSTLGAVLGKAGVSVPPSHAGITLRQLLNHRAGLPANVEWFGVSRTLPMREQRLAAVRMALSEPLTSTPGTTFLYSNTGYVVAATMAETAAGDTWENLITARIFAPLNMASVGFGPCDELGTLQQPWGHDPHGKPTNGDNPPVMSPAGRVHCTLEDWARFIQDQLRGARHQPALLSPDVYETVQTPPPAADYACGWTVVQRSWGGGAVLTHNGSNLGNYSVVWMAPLKDFALLVTANQGGEDANKATDDVARDLIIAQQHGELDRDRSGQ